MESANNNKKCPICKKAAEVKFQPFCSKRCADVDLGRWLKGSYVIPGESTNIETDNEEADY